MIDTDEIDDDALRWGENLQKSIGTETKNNAEEQKMIARLFGTRTAAEQFLKHERSERFPRPGIPVRQKRAFKPSQVRIHFEYFDRPSNYGLSGGWSIERFENGIKVHVHTGTDYTKRDELLIKLQTLGFTCKPIAIGIDQPQPIIGRTKDKSKPKSKRMAMIAGLAEIDSDDVADFSIDDFEWVANEPYDPTS